MDIIEFPEGGELVRASGGLYEHQGEGTMEAEVEKTRTYDHVIRLLRLARALGESGAALNLAKIFLAAAFSQEIRDRNRKTISPDELDQEIGAVIEALRGGGARTEVLEALRRGQRAVRERRIIPRTEIPEVHACRDCGELFLGALPLRCPTCGAQSATFREFLPAYFLEPLNPAVALNALESAPDELENITRGLTEYQAAWVPGPGRWAIREVLLHLLAVQQLLGARIEKMLTEEDPSLRAAVGVDARLIPRAETLFTADILAQFRASRHGTVERLRGLAFQKWWRTGRHEEFGQITVLQQATYLAKHERYHMPRMEVTRRAVIAKESAAPGV